MLHETRGSTSGHITAQGTHHTRRTRAGSSSRPHAAQQMHFVILGDCTYGRCGRRTSCNLDAKSIHKKHKPACTRHTACSPSFHSRFAHNARAHHRRHVYPCPSLGPSFFPRVFFKFSSFFIEFGVSRCKSCDSIVCWDVCQLGSWGAV